MKGKWVGSADVGVYTDARGNRWGCAAKPEPLVELSASQDTRWHASLLDATNEYGAPVGKDISAASDRDMLLDGIDDWVALWEGDHVSQPGKRTESNLWLLLVLALVVLSDKKRR